MNLNDLGPSMKKFAALILMASALTAKASDGWDGYFVGISTGKSKSTASHSYSHLKGTTSCENNNYGSMGNGTGCGGTEDYVKAYSDSGEQSNTAFKFGKYFQQNDRVWGVIGEFSQNSDFSKQRSEVITSAFGDSLTVAAKRKNEISISGLMGFPRNQFMPFLTAGISSAQVQAKVIQTFENGANDYSRELTRDANVWGYTVGAGLKWKLNKNLIVSTEYVHTAYGRLRLNGETELAPGSGGLRYPTTSLTTKFRTDTVRAGIEYRFN